MNIERWMDVPFDAFYMISDQGRVASKDRVVRSGPGKGQRLVRGRVLKPFLSRSTGYLQVNLTRRDRQNVHVLVALAFLGPRRNGMVVNHKNGVRDDNRMKNLEWVTHRENHLHAYAVLGKRGSSMGQFSGDHPTSKAVLKICLATGSTTRYEAAIDAAREGFDSGSISKCCRGIARSHKGFRWQFANQAAAPRELRGTP